MVTDLPLAERRGARCKADVPQVVLKALASGTTETVNLMEWLAADMIALARCVAKQAPSTMLRAAFNAAANEMTNKTLIDRLTVTGRIIAGTLRNLHSRAFDFVANHRSDLVRQWACFAVNDADIEFDMEERLKRTLQFAADGNANVREVAWLAFRPHVIGNLPAALSLLEPLSRHQDARLRRFAIEGTRPRSVWGAHIAALKQEPAAAVPLLENVRADSSRYVQLAVGNWLNDAGKTRPDWVRAICARWAADGHRATDNIIRRGMRSLARGKNQKFGRPSDRTTTRRKENIVRRMPC